MSPAEELLQRLHSQGVRLSPDGDRIRVTADADVVTDTFYTQILYYKTELLQLLSPGWRDPADAAPETDHHSRVSAIGGPVVEATFRGGVRIQVRPHGPGHYVLCFRWRCKWHKDKRFITPFSDHARRTAEGWFGPPLGGWYEPEVPNA